MKEFNNVGRGWRPLLTQLFDDLARSGWVGNVLQIKQKLGSLRVHIDPMTTMAATLIIGAEDRSLTICEACGKPGEVREFPSGYLKTLCLGCWRKQHLKVTGQVI